MNITSVQNEDFLYHYSKKEDNLVKALELSAYLLSVMIELISKSSRESCWLN